MRRLSPVELCGYDHVPPGVARRAWILRVPVLPPGAGGMTLGRLILLREDDPGHRTGRSELLAHELVHVHQWADLGVPRFLWRYLASYGRNLRRLRRHHLAYLAIPLEEDARAAAAEWASRRALGPNRRRRSALHGQEREQEQQRGRAGGPGRPGSG